jgi:hypothetical protein
MYGANLDADPFTTKIKSIDGNVIDIKTCCTCRSFIDSAQDQNCLPLMSGASTKEQLT